MNHYQNSLVKSHAKMFDYLGVVFYTLTDDYLSNQVSHYVDNFGNRVFRVHPDYFSRFKELAISAGCIVVSEYPDKVMTN